MWTQFMDMHSGGGTKEPPYQYIYIEAPEDEARVIFYNRFGHNPECVTCTCCGDDYSITESKSLLQATGFERGCAYSYRDTKGREVSEEKAFVVGKGVRRGYTHGYVERATEKYSFGNEYASLCDYKNRDDVLIIEASEIDPKHRIGAVPEQGYVWKD
jgi:hypothetical protein